MKSFCVRIVLCLSFVLTGGILEAAGSDVGKRLIFDMPKGEMMRRYGKLAGQDLTPEESAALGSYQFDGDTLKLLVILVEWIDRPGTYSKETFESFFFSRNEYPEGSVADYFDEVSYGRLVIEGDVIDWYNAGYYNQYFDFESVLYALDGVIDFSQYDGNGDYAVDAICFVRSGNGEEDSQDPNDIWSYAWIGYVGSFDGVTVNTYNTSPETRPLRDPANPTQFLGVDALNRIRVFCHELTHNLGQPDLYDYDDKLVTSTYYTPDDYNDHPVYDWCLMGYYGYGLFSLGQDVPVHLCGWTKTKLGWIDPVMLRDFEGEVAIKEITTNADSSLFLLPINAAEGEYFLLEYRNPQTTAMFDRVDSDFSCYFWPNLAYGCDPLDRGLLITHVHDSLLLPENWWRINNGTPYYAHYTVAVEDAGYDPARPETYNPEGHVTDSAQWWYPYETRKGALFSNDVAGQSEFSVATTPSSDGYYGESGIYVRVDSIVGDCLYAYIVSPNDWTCYDSDSDGYGDPDVPGNYCPDDNCPEDYNPDQANDDGDTYGDVCDKCPQFASDDNEDGDGDTIGDVCDNCPYTYNPDQNDSDEDGIGDLCDPDFCCESRGDVNNNLAVDAIDMVFLVDYFWSGGDAPPCTKQADVNADEQVDVMDLLYLIEYFWMDGPAPVPCPD